MESEFSNEIKISSAGSYSRFLKGRIKILGEKCTFLLIFKVLVFLSIIFELNRCELVSKY